jgi:hypothetical protein
MLINTNDIHTIMMEINDMFRKDDLLKRNPGKQGNTYKEHLVRVPN